MSLQLAARLEDIRATLIWLSRGWLEDKSDREYCAELAERLRCWSPGDLSDLCCPMCEEVDCDNDCPFGQVRWLANFEKRGAVPTCVHPDVWFDRTICPEPCGMMHYYCTECGGLQDKCYWSELAVGR